MRWRTSSLALAPSHALAAGPAASARRQLPGARHRHCDERIFMGGRGAKHLYQCSLQGELLAEIPVSSSVVYSVAWHCGQPANLLSVGGSSSRLDLCTPNFAYKDRTA